jgi:hypothetical protein
MTITGAVIMGFFATLWWTIGLRSAGAAPAVVYFAPIVVTAILAATAWRISRRASATPVSDADAAEHARRDRLIGWASAVEGRRPLADGVLSAEGQRSG